CEFRRPHIGEDETVQLAHRIGALAEILADAAGRGLGRRFKDRAVDIVEPAVIAAANAALGRNAELQRGAAMGAVLVQEAEPAALIAEEHQLLAQKLHQLRRLTELRAQQKRMPEAA